MPGQPNRNVPLLDSAARTADTASADQENYHGRGLHVVIDVTVDPAAASVVPHIQGKDEKSGNYYDLLVGAAIVALGVTVLKVYPGIGTLAGAAASDILPTIWRVNMDHADGDSITYSVAASVIR